MAGLYGAYRLDDLAPDTYTVEVIAPGFFDAEQAVTVTPGQPVLVNAQLVLKADLPCLLYGRVTDGANPIDGARITATLGVGRTATTNSEGDYAVPNLPPGAYDLHASAVGYNAQTTEVAMAAGATEEANFELSAAGQDAKPGCDAPAERDGVDGLWGDVAVLMLGLIALLGATRRGRTRA